MPARRLLRALGHRNFRLYFVGQGVSMIGTWMQQMATAWLVYLLTGSAFWLGLVSFAGQVPVFLLAPLAGVVADRANRHRLLLLTQTLFMLQAFALAWLALAGTVNVWQVLALSAFTGLVNPLDMTTRQAFLTEMVPDRADLANAVALNSSLVNGARLVGPALAGLLLARTSPGVCFLVNGLSYLAVLLALLVMRVPRPAGPRQQGPFLRGLAEGVVYAFGFAPIRALLLLVAAVSAAGAASAVLLPVVATEVLHGNADTLGLLSAASGVGALVAAGLLMARGSVLGLGRWLVLAPGLLGGALVGFAWAGRLGTALPALTVAGFGLMTHLTASNTILQTIVDEDKRGRVLSLYTAAFLGVAPLASLLAGWLADRVGVRLTLEGFGVVCLAAGGAFATQLPRLRQRVRPIYRRLGILPEALPDVPGATPVLVPLAAERVEPLLSTAAARPSGFGDNR